MRAAGFDFVIRYIVPGRSVSITAVEYRTLRAGGIDVAGVWERGASRSLAGRAAGAHDAAEALAYVPTIGGPADSVPYLVADDFGATAADMPAIASYLLGVADTAGRGRRAAYGGLRTIRYLFDHDLIDYGWQTYAWSGSSQARAGDIDDHAGTAWDPRAQLRQKPNGQILGGAEVDFDTATVADFGQWNYQEADMSQAEVDAVNAHTDGQVAEVLRVLTANLGSSAVNNPASWLNAGIAARLGANERALIAPLLDDEAKLTAYLDSIGVTLAALSAGGVSLDDLRAALRVVLADVRLTTATP